jgi:hypothetical protein
MSRRDTTKVYKTSLHNQEIDLDVMPHKSVRKAKKKDRQAGKKTIGQALIESLREAVSAERNK